MQETRACRVIFGASRGEEVHEMVEEMTSGQCRRLCPLLDRTGWSPLLVDNEGEMANALDAAV